MKKLFAILLAAAMILSLAGCAKEEVPTIDAVEVPVADEPAAAPETDAVPEVPVEDVPEIMIPSADAVELPPAQPDPNNQFGVDVNINVSTIDEWLGLEDVAYRDVRMLIDPGCYEAICGDSVLSGIVDGFEVVPYPYLASLFGLPPEVAETQYDGDKLFDLRRVVRVVVPFLLWSAVYAFAWGNPAENFQNLLLNFNYSAGHLWFVYMLIGVYLLMPLLSPWAERVSKRELQVYLGIWAFTTIIPLLRDVVGGGFDGMEITYGVSGLPRPALTPLWGEASWNTYGTFYYISGFVGYLLMGLYFRRFVGELSWKKTLAISVPSYLAGFVVVFGGFLRRVFEMTQGEFPVTGLVEKAVWWETTWCNDTVGVALMTVAWILVFKKIKCEGKFYNNILLPVSRASYGIYLLHLLLLVPISGAVRDLLGLGNEGVLGVWTTPVEIVVSAILGFAASAVVAVALQRVPKIGKYIAG